MRFFSSLVICRANTSGLAGMGKGFPDGPRGCVVCQNFQSTTPEMSRKMARKTKNLQLMEVFFFDGFLGVGGLGFGLGVVKDSPIVDIV